MIRVDYKFNREVNGRASISLGGLAFRASPRRGVQFLRSTICHNSSNHVTACEVYNNNYNNCISCISSHIKWPTLVTLVILTVLYDSFVSHKHLNTPTLIRFQTSRRSPALGIFGIKESLRSLNVVWSDPKVRSSASEEKPAVCSQSFNAENA